MITGAHSIIYSSNPEADRNFFRNVLKFPNIDIGEGWLIFKLPPSEMAVHPSSEGTTNELYLTCDDVEKFMKEMASAHIVCSDIQNLGWGRLTTLTLPGGGVLGVYQPRHARP